VHSGICTAAVWINPLVAPRSFFVCARKLAQKHTSIPTPCVHRGAVGRHTPSYRQPVVFKPVQLIRSGCITLHSAFKPFRSVATRHRTDSRWHSNPFSSFAVDELHSTVRSNPFDRSPHAIVFAVDELHPTAVQCIQTRSNQTRFWLGQQLCGPCRCTSASTTTSRLAVQLTHGSFLLVPTPRAGRPIYLQWMAHTSPCVETRANQARSWLGQRPCGARAGRLLEEADPDLGQRKVPYYIVSHTALHTTLHKIREDEIIGQSLG
jgi:hypothetical protein